MRTQMALAVLVSVVFVGAGCGEKPTLKPASDPVSNKKDGPDVLRVIRPAVVDAGLPRGEEYEVRETALIRNFAHDHGLEIKWTTVPPEQLADELMEKRGDVAIGCRLEWIDANAKLLLTRPLCVLSVSARAYFIPECIREWYNAAYAGNGRGTRIERADNP